jgi:hypothetical protein
MRKARAARMLARTVSERSRKLAVLTAARVRQRIVSEGALVGLTTLLALMWMCGLSVDVWYHVHRGFQIESFFTPAHALLYGGMTLSGVPALVYLADSIRLGTPWSERLPPGFRLALVGWALYGMGGAFDFLWHATVGFEVTFDAVLSPSHVWLAFAFTLFVVGLLRGAEAWRRSVRHGASSLRLYDLPVVLTLAMLLRSLAWYLTYASPLTADFATGGASVRALDGYADIAWSNLAGHMAGATGIFLEAALVSMVLVASARYLRLPTGGLAGLMVVYAVFVVVSTDQWLALGAVLAGAVVAEVIWVSIRGGWLGGPEAGPSYWVLGGAVPLAQTAAYMALLALIGGGLVWTPHLWVGVPIVAGIYGLIAAVLSMPQSLFAKDIQSATISESVPRNHM